MSGIFNITNYIKNYLYQIINRNKQKSTSILKKTNTNYIKLETELEKNFEPLKKSIMQEELIRESIKVKIDFLNQTYQNPFLTNTEKRTIRKEIIEYIEEKKAPLKRLRNKNTDEINEFWSYHYILDNQEKDILNLNNKKLKNQCSYFKNNKNNKGKKVKFNLFDTVHYIEESREI